MAQVSALHQALALAGSPVLAAAMRAQPLPGDALWLIQIAAGDEASLRRGEVASGARASRLQEAAALYVQHVVFAPKADHYRVLAVRPDASQATLREHVGWLMKWLHPDRAKSEWESVFAQRVLAAWNELKTPEKRAAYDRTLPPAATDLRTPSGQRRALVRTPRAVPFISRRPDRAFRARLLRIGTYVLAGVIATTVIVALAWSFGPDPEAADAPSAAVSTGN